MTPIDEKTISPENAIKLVKSHQNIVVSHVSAEPRHFFEMIGNRAHDVHDTRIYCANPTQNYPCFVDPEIDGHLSFDMMFLNPHVRQKLKLKHVTYAPSHMSRWTSHILASATARKNSVKSKTFTERSVDSSEDKPIDIFWGTCSAPDTNGFVSLGLNSCYEPEVLRKAKCVILEMNPSMPFTFGATAVNINDVNFFIPQMQPIPAHQSPEPGPEELKIGEYVAELVADGSTIQLGIGAIPNAIGKSLVHRKNLGVHTEMINDAIMHLYQAGAIDGSRKTLWPGKIIGAFVYGSERLYKFLDHNPEIELHPASVVNERSTIARNFKMTSINTAVEIDLTGQVCSESVGHGEITGVGGASDTHVGAQQSRGGRGIIALRSTTKDGLTSKIVFGLATGAKVSISRNDIDTVITENGIAELAGKNARERAKAMIAIAHPDFRDQLLHDAKRDGYI